MSDIKNKIIEVVKKIYDPEIPVNIYELGLIYKIEVDEKNKVNVDMTLTSPNCPVAESLPNEVKNNINPDDIHYPVTKLVALENTCNRGGGVCYDLEEIQKISSFCRQEKLATHLDGARLFNALVKTGVEPQNMGENFDSISLCFSKGLGTPLGSVLIGTNDFIKKARRVRKVLGGGMRQVGMVAAAGIYALENNIDRLEIDHNHASVIADALKKCSWIESVLDVETNIVVGNELILYFLIVELSSL